MKKESAIIVRILKQTENEGMIEIWDNGKVSSKHGAFLRYGVSQ
jgi:ribosomal protein S19E (S16A)